MTWDVLQHIVVTLVAIAAAGVLLRQVGAFLWPKPGAAACANCASKASPARTAPAPGGKTVMTVPVIRSRSSHR